MAVNGPQVDGKLHEVRDPTCVVHWYLPSRWGDRYLLTQ